MAVGLHRGRGERGRGHAQHRVARQGVRCALDGRPLPAAGRRAAGLQLAAATAALAAPGGGLAGGAAVRRRQGGRRPQGGAGAAVGAVVQPDVQRELHRAGGGDAGHCGRGLDPWPSRQARPRGLHPQDGTARADLAEPRARGAEADGAAPRGRPRLNRPRRDRVAAQHPRARPAVRAAARGLPGGPRPRVGGRGGSVRGQAAIQDHAGHRAAPQGSQLRPNQDLREHPAVRAVLARPGAAHQQDRDVDLQPPAAGRIQGGAAGGAAPARRAPGVVAGDRPQEHQERGGARGHALGARPGRRCHVRAAGLPGRPARRGRDLDGDARRREGRLLPPARDVVQDDVLPDARGLRAARGAAALRAAGQQRPAHRQGVHRRHRLGRPVR
ncbi:hypothetical protein FOCC_FOCC017448, partial [Frankliniella occidentalis]